MKPGLLDPPADRPAVTAIRRSPFTEEWPPSISTEPFGGYTIDQIHERLGPVPAWRVRSWPPPGTATFKDAIACANRGELCELVDGILLEKTVGFWESVLAVRISSELRGRAAAGNHGIVAGADGPIELPEEQSRMPDATFVSWKQAPGGFDPTIPVPNLPPTIAVEVISASHTWREMDQKLVVYFNGGASFVWYVYPRTRTVRVYTAVEMFETLSADAGDALSAGDVLPGFAMSLVELFMPPQPPAADAAGGDPDGG